MKILDLFAQRTGQIALLIDPEKSNDQLLLTELVRKAEIGLVDYLFVGGSTVTRTAIEEVVSILKGLTQIPVVLFPGASHQISKEADALLFLNLISGRNPDYLIGHQVASAEEIFSMPLEVISTSYLLIDGGTSSSVAYVSQTTPIPQHQVSIATNTAKAGFLMGHQLVYMDAGSGAKQSVSIAMIESISKSLKSPLIIGGGIKSIEKIKALSAAGANVVVIGNKIETDIDFLLDLSHLKSDLNTK